MTDAEQIKDDRALLNAVVDQFNASADNAFARWLRRYEADECGKDGYPFAWHEGVKDAIRELAGHRCVRCGHPYRKGKHGSGEWSRCDERCTHETGAIRLPDAQPPLEIGRPAGWYVTRGERVEAQWRILTVHHLTGVKYDLRWWNLAALCQRCHLTIQGRVRMEQVYPHEHSEWFKPYAAGYYAAAYLGEDISPREARARLDDLLALERAA